MYLAACHRDGPQFHSGCRVLAHDPTIQAPISLSGQRLFWTESANGTDYLHWVDVNGGPIGGMVLHDWPTTGLRVAGDSVAFRAGGSVYTGRISDGSSAKIWGAPNGSDVDISQGRVYWSQSATTQFPGCVGSANLDGIDGRCLEQGQHVYGGVKVDDSAVFFIRDGDIFRLAN